MHFLTTFKDYLKDVLLRDPEVKKTLSEVSGSTLTSLSKAVEDAPSKIASFGIGIILPMLGEYLVMKNRGSTAARAIARILGADVDNINRDYVINKLKDKGYFNIIQKGVIDVIETKSINNFAASLDPPLTKGEAWEVYRQIKDMIVDEEILRMLSQVSNATTNASAYMKSLGSSIQQRMQDEHERIQNNFKKQLTQMGLSEANLLMVTPLTNFGKGKRACWEDGIFRNEDIKSG